MGGGGGVNGKEHEMVQIITRNKSHLSYETTPTKVKEIFLTSCGPSA